MASNVTADAKASGTFSIGGDLGVHRLGFGAMRIVGKGIWGDTDDLPGVKETLKKLPELGINLIDTADSYGPFYSEEHIAEALHPYPKGMVIATKGGLARTGPDVWLPVGRPEYLQQCVHLSLRRLKVERIDLWQLHRIDPKVPRDEQFSAIAELQKQGLIRHLGISEVSVDEIKAAGKFFKVATVQNLYNLVNRQSEAVLDYCTEQDIGFIPWFPLAAGSLAKEHSALDEIAKRHEVEQGAVALAWLLKRSKVMLPIPGTGKVKHLVENVRGASLKLTDDEFKKLDEQGKSEWKKAK
jgi:pyridoxine 4-dehydrogenase